ncbi:hypothetical protein AZ002_004789 [Citrobacter freundii]|nr:hypothetical protein AZ002_004789 [Citrobacter freundii]
MEFLVTFAQKQNFGAWRDVKASDWFGVVRDIAFCFFSEQSEIVFTRH